MRTVIIASAVGYLYTNRWKRTVEKSLLITRNPLYLGLTQQHRCRQLDWTPGDWLLLASRMVVLSELFKIVQEPVAERLSRQNILLL
jgi:hypothetical protein